MRFHPVISIIISIIIVSLFTWNLPGTSLINSLILIVPFAILGGFIATFLSKNNKTVYGSFFGMVWSLPYVLYGTVTRQNTYFLFVISFLIFGYVGGYIASLLRVRLDNKETKNL
nr:hypothetical protein [uncultured Methanobacterium sp.]